VFVATWNRLTYLDQMATYERRSHLEMEMATSSCSLVWIHPDSQAYGIVKPCDDAKESGSYFEQCDDEEIISIVTCNPSLTFSAFSIRLSLLFFCLIVSACLIKLLNVPNSLINPAAILGPIPGTYCNSQNIVRMF
jgi:hypothetical protein